MATELEEPTAFSDLVLPATTVFCELADSVPDCAAAPWPASVVLHFTVIADVSVGGGGGGGGAGHEGGLGAFRFADLPSCKVSDLDGCFSGLLYCKVSDLGNVPGRAGAGGFEDLAGFGGSALLEGGLVEDFKDSSFPVSPVIAGLAVSLIVSLSSMFFAILCSELETAGTSFTSNGSIFTPTRSLDSRDGMEHPSFLGP